MMFFFGDNAVKRTGVRNLGQNNQVKMINKFNVSMIIYLNVHADCWNSKIATLTKTKQLHTTLLLIV